MTEKRPAPPPLNLRASAGRSEGGPTTSPVDVFRQQPPTPGTPAAGPSRSGSSTPFPTSSRGTPPGSLMQSPQKQIRVQSLQAQIAHDRSDIMDELKASESRTTLRIDELEKLVRRATATARDDRGRQAEEFERYKLNVENRLALLEKENELLRNRVDELEALEVGRNTKVAKSSKAARAILGDKTYLAVQAVVHKTVAFLYNTDESPWPDWPREDEPWPRFETEDQSEGDACLRFDYSQPVDHTHNVGMLEYLVGYIDTHRSALPADLHEAELAKDVDKSAFFEAGKKYFQSLKKYRKKVAGTAALDDVSDDGQDDGPPTNSLLLTVAESGPSTHSGNMGSSAVLGGAEEPYTEPETLATVEAHCDRRTGVPRPLSVSESDTDSGTAKRPRTMPSLPDATRRRNRRLTSATAVKLRRPLVLEYAGPEYEVLDETHSQISEMDVEGRRVWIREQWMSEANVQAIEGILTAPLSHNKRYSSTSRSSQDTIELVVAHPPWPTKAPERYLQRWQLSQEYLANHCVGLDKQIVPTDVPLAIADVMRTGWYAKYHSGRTMAPGSIGGVPGLSRASSLSSGSPSKTPTPLPKSLPSASASQLSYFDKETDTGDSEGFDDGARGAEGRSRSRSRSGSRSRSPVKHTPTAPMTRILEETSSGLLRELEQQDDRSIESGDEENPSF